MKRTIYVFAALFLFAIAGKSAYAQEALKPRPSPLYVSTMKHGDTYIKVTYSRPHKRDREIFGELVPFGKVWRTGANEATEITVTGDISLDGNKLKAGTYSLYTIPKKDEWTIIINRAVGQWGAYEYDKEKDVLRFGVPVESTNETYEPFTIEFRQEDESASMVMMWDRTMVSIPISFP